MPNLSFHLISGRKTTINKPLIHMHLFQCSVLALKKGERSRRYLYNLLKVLIWPLHQIFEMKRKTNKQTNNKRKKKQQKNENNKD